LTDSGWFAPPRPVRVRRGRAGVLTSMSDLNDMMSVSNPPVLLLSHTTAWGVCLSRPEKRVGDALKGVHLTPSPTSSPISCPWLDHYPSAGPWVELQSPHVGSWWRWMSWQSRMSTSRGRDRPSNRHILGIVPLKDELPAAHSKEWAWSRRQLSTLPTPRPIIPPWGRGASPIDRAACLSLEKAAGPASTSTHQRQR